MPAQTNKRLPGLEMLRLVAATCVLFLHAMANYGAAFWGAKYFGRGYLGVDFFLMLSGFLMARTQQSRMEAGASPWAFLGKRYRRLWPMMALGGLIGLPRLWLLSHGAVDFALTAGANLLLLPVPGHQFVFPLNVPAWTIACELLCNAAFVLVLWRVPGRWIWAVVAALLPVNAWIGYHYGYYNVGAQPANFPAGIARTLFAYTLGIALARQWAVKAPSVPWWLAVPLMPALLVIATQAGLWGPWYELGFILLACPLMIAGGLGLDRYHGLAEWMGRLSFPLFALQMPIVEGLRLFHGTYWTAIAAAFAISILAMRANI
jgi:peptidoglycan/LPS O-acetylase OafA/YrhL